MKSLIKEVIKSFVILIIAIPLFVVLAGWTEPSQAPTEDNAPAPLNVSDTPQSKTAGLFLNTGGAEYGLIVNGNVAIGTSTVPAHPTASSSNLSVNDIYLRIANKWLSEGIKGVQTVQAYVESCAIEKNGEEDCGGRGDVSGYQLTKECEKNNLYLTILSPNNATKKFANEVFELLCAADSKSLSRIGKSFNSPQQGIHCKGSNGWLLTGCWNARDGAEDIDIAAYKNGCISNDIYSSPNKTEMNIVCIK